MKSSDTGPSSEGTFAPYHPCPKELLAGDCEIPKSKALQRFANYWCSGVAAKRWDSPTVTPSLFKLILEKSIGSRLFLLRLCASVDIKSTSAQAAGLTPSLPSPGEECRPGESAWVGWRGYGCLHDPAICPLEYSSSCGGTLGFKEISLNSSISMERFGR